ncbi:MAG: hypothetical protein M3268_07180 [Acidobacteriota bacterium]|nr:hypothetical protein [Acidobacteriota bacterium]
MNQEETSRAWLVAAVPFALMACAGVALYFAPGWSNTMPALPFVLLVGASPLVGVGVLIYVLWGWRGRRLRMRRAQVAAALVFAALDILVPAGLLFIVWLIARAMSNLMT